MGIITVGNMKILFFSRGRGRGHAIPDVAIAKELLKIETNSTVQFVSYGTGAETIRQCGFEVEDLKLPDDNPYLETLIRSIQIINEYQPSLILSHEEFCILPAARVFQIPCLFLIDWFPPNGTVWMDSLVHATRVIFMDDPGYFDEPSEVKNKIEYVGPVIRELSLTRAHRNAARADLGLPVNCPLVLIIPGGSPASSEEKAPIFDLVTGAIDILDEQVVTVWVLPLLEQERVRDRVSVRSDTVLMSPHLNIERTMVAADLVITKATRMTSWELNALEISSISISHGLNPIDDYRVAQIKTNRALRARGLTAVALSAHIKEVLAEQTPPCGTPKNAGTGRLATVAAIRRQALSAMG